MRTLEQIAVDLLRTVEESSGQRCVRDGRPTADVFEPAWRCDLSSGEAELVELAVDAWRAAGVWRALARLDQPTRALVVHELSEWASTLDERSVR